MLTRLRSWLRSTLLRRRLDRDMREEMETHLEQAAERLVARGLPPEEARRQARREFGNVAYVQEMGREAWGSRWIDSGVGDLRFGLRHFARAPLVTATILLLLTLGIGANTALFTVAHSVLTGPPPGIPRDDALVRIRVLQRTFAAFGTRSMSYPEFLSHAGHTEIFASAAAWTSSSVVLDPTGAGEDALPARATYVSDGYFGVLGVHPVLGGLPPASGSGGPMAVIGHSLWAERFGAESDVLGRTFGLNGVAVTVVGVAPPRFGGMDADASLPQVWLPLEARAAVEGSGPFALPSPDSAFLQAAARLRSGVTTERATTVVRAVANRWMEARSEPPRGELDADVVPLRAHNARPGSPFTAELVAGSALSLLLLLITCTNVSALLIGLSARRKHEIAVRLSLGASRRRVIRQLVTESVLLTTLGGALAVALVWALVGAFGTRLPDVDMALEWRTLAFTLGVATVTGIVFGLSPAFHATRLGVAEVLKDVPAAMAGSRSRLQCGLVVAQVALTQPLLVGVAVFVLFVGRAAVGRPDAPLRDHILSVSFARWGGEAWRAEIDRFRERLSALPEVVAAVPEAAGYGLFDVAVHPEDRVPGASLESFRAHTTFAASGYFQLMGIPFVRGRHFLPSEREGPERGGGSSAVVVGSDLARELWGDADPLGRRLIYRTKARVVAANGVRAGDGGTADVPPEDWGVVVGVVDEEAAGASDDVSTLRIYVPRGFGAGLLVRTREAAQRFIPRLRTLAQAEWPDVPVSAETLAAEDAARERMVVQVGSAAAAVGLLALLLSSVGLYAVIAFSVARSTREIGVRRALGAEGRRVVGQFLLRGLRLCAEGLAVGLPLGLVGLRIVVARMGIVGVASWLVAGTTATVVLAVACLATWLPARRAAGVDPLIALRSE